MLKAAVVGSRTFKDKEFIYRKLDAFLSTLGPFVVVTGGAEGVDKIAEKWALDRAVAGVPKPVVYQAEWGDTSHPDAVVRRDKYGREYDAVAGHRRNQLIVDDADFLIAFWDGQSKGTKDSVDKAGRANIPSYVYLRDEESSE